MTPVFVKPADGARVRQPERNSAVMPADGGWVARNVHYEGLIASGDLIVVDPQPEVPQAAPVDRSAPARNNPNEPDLSRGGTDARVDSSKPKPAR